MPNTGWTVAKTIAQANGRSENRVANKPNFDIQMEFFQALDEFCQEKHFWWRRKAASFVTVPGQPDYDLSATVAEGGANATDVEEIEEMFVVSAQPFPIPVHCNPAFSARKQLYALFGNPQNMTPFPRTSFFLIPGEFQQLSFTAPPNLAMTIGFTYWAVPMITNTSQAVNQPIPLVPPYLHGAMLYALLRRIFEYLYAQEDPRNVMAEKRYQDWIKIAAKSKQFSSQEAVHASMQGHGVHSSGGRGLPHGFRE